MKFNSTSLKKNIGKLFANTEFRSVIDHPKVRTMVQGLPEGT